MMEERVGDNVEAITIHRIYWRIIPLFFAMMFFNFLLFMTEIWKYPISKAGLWRLRAR